MTGWRGWRFFNGLTKLSDLCCCSKSCANTASTFKWCEMLCFCHLGSTGCRHVQLFLQRRGLCPLLRNSEYSPTSHTCVCTSLQRERSQLHRNWGNTDLASRFIYFAVMSFLLFAWFISPPTTHFHLWFFSFCVCVCVALRSSGWLSQKVPHCSGELVAHHPGPAR